jgi:cytoskeletal protein RodZ
MATVAEQLRQAREKMNLTVHQAAELTKIKTDHIRALESGQYDAFTAAVYVRGFARTYARYLKLDEPRLLADLDIELEQVGAAAKSPDTISPAHRPFDSLTLELSRLNWRLWAGLGAALIAVLVSVTAVRHWRANRNSDPLKNLGPGIYQSTQSSSGELLPIPPPK